MSGYMVVELQAFTELQSSMISVRECGAVCVWWRGWGMGLPWDGAPLGWGSLGMGLPWDGAPLVGWCGWVCCTALCCCW